MIYSNHYFKFLMMLEKELNKDYKVNKFNYVHYWPYNIIDLKTFKLKTTYINKIKPLRVQLYDIYTIGDIIDILNSFGLIPIDDILETIIEEYLKIYPIKDEVENIEYLMNNQCSSQIEEYATQTLWFAINYSLRVKKMNDKLKKRYFLKLSQRNIVGSQCNFECIKHLKMINNNSNQNFNQNKSINQNLFTLDLPCFKRKNDLISDCQNDCPCFRRKESQ